MAFGKVGGGLMKGVKKMALGTKKATASRSLSNARKSSGSMGAKLGAARSAGKGYSLAPRSSRKR